MSFLGGAPDDLTQTEAFRRWFGNSVVVYDDGQPAVVFHGTSAKFDTFDIRYASHETRAGNAVLGFFFTDDYDLARDTYSGKRGRVMEVYLSIQNPFRISDEHDNDMGDILRMEAKKYLEHNPETTEDWLLFRDYLKLRGNDGIEFLGYAGDPRFQSTVYVAFEPWQIKSATGNRGTFDPNDPNILHGYRRR